MLPTKPHCKKYLNIGNRNLHSSKILKIQQGLPRRVSSVGNPWGPLTGAEESSNGKSGQIPHVEVTAFRWGRVAAAHMFNLYDIYHGVWKGLTTVLVKSFAHFML